MRDIWWPLALTIVWGVATGLLFVLGFIHLVKTRRDIPVLLRFAYPILVIGSLLIPAEFLPKPIVHRPRFLYEVFLLAMIVTVVIPAATSRMRK